MGVTRASSRVVSPVSAGSVFFIFPAGWTDPVPLYPPRSVCGARSGTRRTAWRSRRWRTRGGRTPPAAAGPSAFRHRPRPMHMQFASWPFEANGVGYRACVRAGRTVCTGDEITNSWTCSTGACAMRRGRSPSRTVRRAWRPAGWLCSRMTRPTRPAPPSRRPTRAGLRGKTFCQRRRRPATRGARAGGSGPRLNRALKAAADWAGGRRGKVEHGFLACAHTRRSTPSHYYCTRIRPARSGTAIARTRALAIVYLFVLFKSIIAAGPRAHINGLNGWLRTEEAGRLEGKRGAGEGRRQRPGGRAQEIGAQEGRRAGVREAIIKERRGRGNVLLLRFLVVPASGCDRAGVGFAAFATQPDRCARPRGSCLRAQPLDLWRRDAWLDAQFGQGRPGKYFLQSFARLPPQPLRLRPGSDDTFLALAFDGALQDRRLQRARLLRGIEQWKDFF
ncbi:Putative conserved plasma membrane protein [Gryllus bimaculatus]|nr:Putative conserved plasma membrane protein [Gryllus bimaculatus]